MELRQRVRQTVNAQRERHRHHFREVAIVLQAGGAADAVIDQRIHGAASPFRFNAQASPDGLPIEIFSERTGYLAVRLVELETQALAVAYDHEASLQATQDRAVARPETQPPHAILVFSAAEQAVPPTIG